MTISTIPWTQFRVVSNTQTWEPRYVLHGSPGTCIGAQLRAWGHVTTLQDNIEPNLIHLQLVSPLLFFTSLTLPSPLVPTSKPLPLFCLPRFTFVCWPLKVSFSGSLIENLDNLAANNHIYASGWNSRYAQAFNTYKTSGGFPKLDFVSFTYHHVVATLVDKYVWGINEVKSVLILASFYIDSHK